MLTIRLSRVGKKKQPFYRFIVSEKTHDPWGKALELLGTYNPLTNPSTLVLEKERIEYWISKGAQCSGTVWNLLIEQGIVKGEKRHLTTMKKRHVERIAKKQKAKA
jgi:small subunit ribosomal protein S16